MIRYASLLDCRHTTTLSPPPLAGDRVWCARCAVYRSVLIVSLEYRLYCPQCKWGTSYGEDRDRAVTVASRHVRRFADHVVELRRGDEIVEKIFAPPTETIVTSP